MLTAFRTGRRGARLLALCLLCSSSARLLAHHTCNRADRLGTLSVADCAPVAAWNSVERSRHSLLALCGAANRVLLLTPSRRPRPIGCSSAPDIKQREHHPYTSIFTPGSHQAEVQLAAAKFRTRPGSSAPETRLAAVRSAIRLLARGHRRGPFTKWEVLAHSGRAFASPRNLDAPEAALAWARQLRALDISHRVYALCLLVCFANVLSDLLCALAVPLTPSLRCRRQKYTAQYI